MTFYVFLVAAGLVFVFIQQSGIARVNAEIAKRLSDLEIGACTCNGHSRTRSALRRWKVSKLGFTVG